MISNTTTNIPNDTSNSTITNKSNSAINNITTTSNATASNTTATIATSNIAIDKVQDTLINIYNANSSIQKKPSVSLATANAKNKYINQIMFNLGQDFEL
jgi:hypothetical protein